ncbi:MAG: PAS domain S-box protein [Desulfovibrionaceae bacterium]|nr:PAS domain S-box protein [Desulfovibrionaceae bacterium]
MKNSSPSSPQLGRLPEHAVNPRLVEQMLDALDMAMAIRDEHLVPVFANQAFREFYGMPMEYLQDKRQDLILPESTLGLYANEVLPAMAAGRAWEGAYAIRTATGELREVRGRFIPVRDDSGALTHVVSTMRGASDYEQVRKVLTQTERHLTFLTENTSDCLFRVRLSDGSYDYVSPTVQNITGYSQQEFYATPKLFRRLVPDDWMDTVKMWWRELREGNTRYEYELPLMHRNGNRRWIHQRIRVSRDDAGKPVAAEGILTDITDRHMTEDALAAAQKSLNFISNSTSDIFFRLRIPEGTYDYLSPSVERFSGYTLEEYAADPRLIKRVIHPDWRDYFQKTWEDLLRGEIRPVYEFQYVHKSGEVRWASQRVILHKDEDGTPIAIEGMATNVTERKAAEEAARENAQRFRVLFEDSPISLWEEDLTDLKAYFDALKDRGIEDFREFFRQNPEALARCASLVKVVNINKATLTLLGARTKEELLGNLEKVLTESSMAAFTEEMILLATGGREYCGEITHRTLDGEIIWVMVHFFVPPEYADTLSRVIVSLLDVTPRKRAEEALMDSEERYRVLAENSQDGVIVFQDGDVRYINERTAAIFERDLSVLDQNTLISSIHPEDRDHILALADQMKSDGKEASFTSVRIITGTGRTRWLTSTAKPIMWDGREAQLGILTDVTRHKILERELLRAHVEMENRIKKRTAELSEANVRLKAEAEERGKAQERILSLTQQLIRIQEDERQRISRDLHDNVAQDLSSIMLKMETLFDDQSCVNDELMDRGRNVAEILHKAIASVRDIAYGLRPPALEQFGLVGALETLCQDVASKHSYVVDFFATGLEDIQMDYDAEINIYRMIQEAVRNISRHAGASKATIRMVKSHPDILIRIEDNGRGFNLDQRLEKAAAEKRMGVRSMEERTRLFGGVMEIQSLPGTGTRVLIKIPIEKAGRRE